MFRYSIFMGAMDRDGKSMPGQCYSGHGEGKNNPDMIAKASIGPIPPGKYRIEPAIHHPVLGPMALPLTPLPGNEMFGRSGFFIHGDSVAHPGDASHGCIVAPHDMRLTINLARDRVLEVGR